MFQAHQFDNFYFYACLYVKKNKSGVVRIQVLDKSSEKYKVFKTIGSSDYPTVIEELTLQTKEFIKKSSILYRQSMLEGTPGERRNEWTI